MDNKGKAGVIFSALLGVLQATGLFVSVANEWTAWLSGHEAVVVLILSTLVGTLQTFTHKVPVKPAVVASMFSLVLLAGCAQFRSALANIHGGFTAGGLPKAPVKFDTWIDGTHVEYEDGVSTVTRAGIATNKRLTLEK